MKMYDILRSFHPQIGKEIPRVCYTLGISLYCPTWTSFIFLPVLNIAYAPGKVKFMHSATGISFLYIFLFYKYSLTLFSLINCPYPCYLLFACRKYPV